MNDRLPTTGNDHVVSRPHLGRRLVGRHPPTPVHRPGTAMLAIRPAEAPLWSRTATRAARIAR